MSRRGRGKCPVCKRVLIISVGGRMLRHNTTEPSPGVLGVKCSGQGWDALPAEEATP
jgi:hypothetical protein